MAAPTSLRIPLPERGVEIAALDWGGDGPLVLMHHANGFCAGTLGLVAEALVDRFRVVAMDARGHGASSKPEGPEAYAWPHFAEDYLAVARRLAAQHGGRVAIALGHSFGGTSALGAAARAPDLFGHLVLVDPVVPVPNAVAHLDPERIERMKKMVERAAKRRSTWPSRAAARAHFAERSLFEHWLPAALDLYVEYGLHDTAAGEVELACPGAVEAAVFGNGATVDVEALARAARVPAIVLWAERGDFSLDVYRRVFGAMERAEIRPVDAGHLIPMERPELVVEAVRDAASAAAA
jgi:pimeloyl-ACP methyl ester carboxylesterase